jgi:hypothetical protein
MNGGFSVKKFWWGLDCPPQLINLNNGVALRKMARLVLSNPHSSELGVRSNILRLDLENG